MSGLAAQCGGGVNRTSTEAVIRRIAYRGDVAPTFWYDSHCALGHVHRATTPEAVEEPHAVRLDNGLVAVADARLDNRVDLIDALGYEATTTDLELLVGAYLAWGTDSPNHLLGDFAFVIWDPVARTLFGCRDHLGVRPLSFGLFDEGVVVASEPKAVAAHPRFADRLDPSYVKESLRHSDVAADRTAFEGVRKLRAGHAFTFSDNQMNVWRYWDIADAPELDLTEAEAAAAFRGLFQDAVSARLRSPGKVAIHLSGGLDSSSIAATAARLSGAGGSHLVAITNTFATVPECDETEHANRVLAATQIEGVTTAADARGPLDTLEDVIDELNEPFVGANHHLVWFLSQAVKNEDCVVCLDGFDGDAVVSHGWESLEELSAARRWEAASSAVDALVATSAHWSRPAVVASHVEPWILDEARRLHLRSALRAGRAVAGKDVGERRALRRRILRAAAGRIVRGHRPSAQETQPIRLSRRRHLEGLPEAGVTRALEWLDLYAALSGAEVRHPFMDKRLVEFCVGLQADLKLRHGYGRWVLRAAMEGDLPDEVRLRPDKTNMNPNFAHGFLQLDADLLRDVLDRDMSELEPNVDAARLEEAVTAMSLDGRASVDARTVATVWRAVVIARVLSHRWPGTLQADVPGPSS